MAYRICNFDSYIIVLLIFVTEFHSVQLIQYSAPNVVGARKLKALIFFTITTLFTTNGHFAFLSPSLGDLGVTYAVHLRLIGKAVVDFLLVIIELFSLGAFVSSHARV